MKLQIKISIISLIGLFINFCVIYPMEIQQVKTRVKIETSDNQHIEIPLQHLANCKTLNYPIELELKKPENNNITSINLATPALNESDWRILEQTLDPQKVKKLTKNELFITLQGSDYLGNEELYKQFCKTWAQRNYSAEKKYTLPLHTEMNIAEEKIAQTTLLQDIPSWVGHDAPFPLIKKLCCQTSTWTCEFNIPGEMVAAGNINGNIYIWNTTTHELITTFKAHDKPISMVQFDHSNNLWTTAQDGSIRCWNITTNKHINTLQTSAGIPFSFRLSPRDSSLLAYENNHNTISVFNNKTATTTNLVGHTSSILSLDIDPHATSIASGGSERIIRIWDIESSSQKNRYNTTSNSNIYHVRFDSQSNRIATGLYRGNIELVDLRSKKISTILKGHIGAAWSSQFYQDNYLISGSKDETIRIWDLRKQACLKSIKAGSQIQDSSLHGNMFATVSCAGSLELWNIAPFVGIIEQTQKKFARNLTLEQARLIGKAYRASPEKPLNCKDKKKRTAAVFGTFNEDQQELLLQNLPITRPIKKIKKIK